jgi:hypothetical protein
MLHRFVHAAIAVFWIATMTAVAVHERRGLPASGGLARLAPPRVEPRPMERFRILFGGRAIGTVTNEITPEPDGGVLVSNRTEGEIPLLGIRNRIDLRVSARLDRASRLTTLRVDLESAATNFSAVGEVRDGFLEVRTQSAGSGSGEPLRIRVPDGAWIQPGAGLLASVPIDARPGDRWTFPILNPLSLTIDVGRATVVAEREERDESGVRLVREIELAVGALTSRAFVDASGALLREETPLGLSLERVGAPPESPR